MWPGSFSVEVDCTKTKILNNIQWTCITQITRRRYLDHDQCPCTHTCTFNVLADTKSLLKKYTHGFSSIACTATYFGFHGCHVLFGIMSSILCGYGMPDTGPRDGSICRFCHLSCKRLGTHTLNIICKLF